MNESTSGDTPAEDPTDAAIEAKTEVLPKAASGVRDPHRKDDDLHGGRKWTVRLLLVTATVLGVVAVFAIWANRQVLDADNWANTSSQLLQNKAVKAQVSGFVVDQIYANVDVTGEIQSALPKQLKPLAGPAAGGLQSLVGDGVTALLERPIVQDAWKESNRLTMRAAINVIEEKKGKYVGAQSGAIVLDLRPLIVGAISRLGLSKGLIGQLPPAAGSIKVISSSQIKTVQSIGQALESLALLLAILVPLLFAIAVFLARGRRRRTLLAVGIDLIVIGVIVLIARIIAGRQVVDALATTEAVRPAVQATWSIATHMLRDVAQATIILSIPLLAAALLAGPADWAVNTRRALAPWLREQRGVCYGILGLVLVFIIAWGPLPATQQIFPVLVMIGLSVLGLEVLRKQTMAEFPDSQTFDAGAALGRGTVKARDAAKRGSSAVSGAISARRESSPEKGGDADLKRIEALASMRDRGVLTDEEFAAQKTAILDGR